jgi:NAD(P)-dependent dehydrogenase (short-subunit alcohol dehydrogenase family)
VLDGQVVVVTGAAGTIGAPVCSAIAAHGGIPIVTDIDSDAADLVAKRIVAEGHPAQAAELDVTDADAIDGLIVAVRERWGRVDAVINNAYPRSANYGRMVEEVEFADFNESVSGHLGGYFLVSQRFARVFREQGGGNIVNLASIYGLSAPDFTLYAGTDMTMPVEYAATKAGVIGLTRYFAQYYLPYGVRCNALAPGGVRDAQPISFMNAYDAKAGTRGLLDAGDLTGTIIYLLSDASRFMTGQVLVVDDGWSL